MYEGCAVREGVNQRAGRARVQHQRAEKGATGPRGGTGMEGGRGDRGRGHSGALCVRPVLDRIMELAEAGVIEAVLAKRRARLFRDRYLRMGYERSLLEYGVRLV